MLWRVARSESDLTGAGSKSALADHRLDLVWLVTQAVDLPPGLAWLGPAERSHLAGLRIAKRRLDWLLGRWTAKSLLADLFDLEDVVEIEILPRSSGSPFVLFRGEEVDISLSLSHRAGAGLCAARTEGVLGCDLELVEERSRGFIEDYFDNEEKTLIRGASDDDAIALVSGMWGAKESVLKLLEKGLTIDTLSLSVRSSEARIPTSWRGFEVRERGSERTYQGWWRRLGPHIVTIVTDPAAGRPVETCKGREGGG